MKHLLRVSALSPLLVLVATAGAQSKSTPLSKQLKTTVASTMASSSASFVENKGQWDKNVRFSGHSGNMDIWLGHNGPAVNVHKMVGKGKFVSQTVKFELANGLSVKGFEAQSLTPTKRNYFKGKDRSKWATNVRAYHEVRSDLGKGLALRYYFYQGHPRYDLIVQPGADPSAFAFNVKGADSLTLAQNGDDLKIGTKAGAMEEKGLFAYQEQNGSRKPVACSMSLKGNIVRFRTGAYDHSKPLVIDPLIFSTSEGDWFFELNQSALPNSVVRDSQGNIWIYGSNIVFDQNGYPDPTLNINKFSPDGKTSLGGSSVFGVTQAQINAMTLDSSDDPVIVGIDWPGFNLPVTSNAYQQQMGSGAANAFVAKFSSDGSQILYCGYLGGSTTDLSVGSRPVSTVDQAYAVKIDSNGNAVVVGNTLSTDFPVTANAFQKTRTPNCQDGFITVLSLNSPVLVASTYFGGAGNSTANPAGGLTAADSVAINSLGNIVVSGFTASKTLPTSVSAYQNANLGTDNAYVAQFSPDLSTLQACTYLGGSNIDLANSMALASDDSVVITGSTTSPNFPYSSGAFNGGTPKLYAAGKYYGAGYVSKLSSDLTTLNWSAFLGSGAPKGLALDAQDEPVVVGIANNNPSVGSVYPTTPQAYQTSYIGKNAAFVSKLSADGSSLLYSTYYGGETAELGYAIAVDNAGNAYIRGITESFDLPLTPVGQYVYEPFTWGAASGFFAEINMTVNSFSMLVSPNSVIGQNTTTGIVTLPVPAPSATTVYLQPSGAYNWGSTAYKLLSVPSSITIAAGSKSGAFPINTATTPYYQHATITAVANGQGITTEFAVNPAVTNSLSFNKYSTVGGSSDTITLTATTNGELAWINNSNIVQLQVTSSNPAVAYVSNSPYQAKGQTSFPFTIGTKPVTSPTTVTFTVSSFTPGHTYAAKSITFTVLPPPVAALSVPQTTVPPGYYENATVYLGGPAVSTGDKVLLSSSNSSAISVPSYVMVTSNNATFRINVGNIAVGQKVNVTASLGGSSKTVTFAGSSAPLPEKLTVSSSTIAGGNAASAYVYLSGKVAQQTTGTATSSNTNALTVPANFTIYSGSQSGLVKVSTVPVGGNTPVTISATVNGLTVSSTVTVLTGIPTSLSLGSSTLKGGSSTTATLTMSLPAPSKGWWLTVRSDNNNVQVPFQVEVMPNATSATFAVKTGAVTTTQTANITASRAGVVVQAQLTVTP